MSTSMMRLGSKNLFLTMENWLNLNSKMILEHFKVYDFLVLSYGDRNVSLFKKGKDLEFYSPFFKLQRVGQLKDIS